MPKIRKPWVDWVSFYQIIGDISAGVPRPHTHIWVDISDFATYLDQPVKEASSPTLEDLTINTPANIYALSHDAFADYAANQHRVWEASIGEDIHDDNISESSVIQHVGAIDHDALLNTHANPYKLDDLAAPDDTVDLDFSTLLHGLVPKGTDVGHFLKDDGTWAAAGNGAATFVGLTDTPANYVGAEKKIVRVNDTPNALEFGADIEDLEDVDTLVGQAGKYAKVKVGDAGIEWAPGGGGAEAFLDLTDTPANYAAAANKIVRVNDTPDALEFGADIEDLEDVDTIVGQAGKYAKVKVGDAGIEWGVGTGNGGAAGPVLIFDSGFDDLALGDIDGKGVYDLWETWVNASGADCTAEIVADGEDGRLLRLDDQSGANECHASLILTEGLYGEVLMGVVEWKVRVSALAANSRGYFNIQDKDIGATEEGAYFRGDSNDLYYRSSSSQTAKLVDAVVDTWYVVRTLFNRLGYYGGSVWWVDTAFKQGPIQTNAGDKFDKLVLSTRDIHSGCVFDIKYVKVWALHYVA